MFLGVTAPKTLMKGFLDFSRKIFIFSLHKNISPFPDQNYPDILMLVSPPPTQGQHEPNPLRSVIEN